MLVDVTIPTDDESQRLLNVGRIAKGVYSCTSFNIDRWIAEPVSDKYPEFNPHSEIFKKKLFRREPANYPDYGKPCAVPPLRLAHLHKGRLSRPEGKRGFIDAYGVCDRPEQLLERYDFEADPRTLVVFFVRLDREDEPESGGWYLPR